MGMFSLFEKYISNVFICFLAVYPNMRSACKIHPDILNISRASYMVVLQLGIQPAGEFACKETDILCWIIQLALYDSHFHNYQFCPFFIVIPDVLVKYHITQDLPPLYSLYLAPYKFCLKRKEITDRG